MECICFVEELVAAYPEAKVVLSLREVDAWLYSMSQTAGRVLAWNSWSIVAPWDPAIAGPWFKHAITVVPVHLHTWADWSPTSPARQAYLDHYERVRKTVPKDRRPPTCSRGRVAKAEGETATGESRMAATEAEARTERPREVEACIVKVGGWCWLVGWRCSSGNWGRTPTSAWLYGRPTT